jgi:hypothetical protein
LPEENDATYEGSHIADHEMTDESYLEDDTQL